MTDHTRGEHFDRVIFKTQTISTEKSMASTTNLTPPRKTSSIRWESQNYFNILACLFALLVYLRDPSKPSSHTSFRTSAVFVVLLFGCMMISSSEANNMHMIDEDYLAEGKIFTYSVEDLPNKVKTHRAFQITNNFLLSWKA